MGGLRRASSVELPSALLRAKKHCAITSGLGGAVGQGSEVPADGTSLLRTSAQMRGSSTRAELVATESAALPRVSRAPDMRYKYLLGNGAHSMGRA